MNIRHVEAHEAERLKAMRLHSLQAAPDAFGSTYAHEVALPEEWWTSRAALSDAGAEQRWFVAVDDEDRWLGMALARDQEGNAVLNAMWVAPEGRGQGIAGALCDACADWAAARGFESLYTSVAVGNDAAERMYERAGFAFLRADTWTGHGRTLHEHILKRTLRT
jgi:ribosomal protein S18 acetylase RimI-like enzyme